MTARILRIELVRSNARWLVLLVLVLLLAFGEAGRGLNVLTFDQRQMLLEAFPLVLGVAAWHAGRDRRSRMDELLATTARPRWHRVLPGAAALVAVVVAAYVVTFAIQVGLVLNAGSHLSPAGLPVAAVGALNVVVPLALGLAAGRWLRLIFVLPLMVVYMAVSIFYADTEAYSEPPGPPGWLLLWGNLQSVGTEFEFAALTASAHLGQAVWAVALVAAGLLVYAGSNLRTHLAAVVPVVVGAALALQLLPARYADAYTFDSSATSLVCTPDAPKVCVTRARQNGLARLRSPAREALAILAEKLPQAPSTAVEVYGRFGERGWEFPPAHPDQLQVVMWLDGNGRADVVNLVFEPVTGRDAVRALLMGAGTPACANAAGLSVPELQRYHTARVVAAAWLLDEEPAGVRLAEPDPGIPWLPSQAASQAAYEKLRALPAAEQRARVASLREAELACDERDRLGILTGSGSAR